MNDILIKRCLELTENEISVIENGGGKENDVTPVFANMSLRRKNLYLNVKGTDCSIAAKPHTRFVDIPLHSHSYIEMMYVLNGSITHYIDDETIALNKGMLLLMNRNTKHRVKASRSRDVGVNFIISNEFLKYYVGSYRNSASLTDFAKNNREDGEPHFLVFQTETITSLENIIEGLIGSLLFENDAPNIIVNETMSLIFRYLEMYPELLVRDSVTAEKGTDKKTIISDYIQTNYRSPSLSVLADKLTVTPQYLCKLIKSIFGASFEELIKERRFLEAERLLTEGELSISEITEAIGYENNSYFHKRFKQEYNMTPAKWRKMMRARSLNKQTEGVKQ